MQIRNTHLWTLAGGFAFAMTAGQASAALLTNGDFETGDFTGWTTVGAGASVDTTTPLAGTTSLVVAKVGSSGAISQTVAAQTSPVTASFIFTTTDPGGATNRSFNPTFRDAQGDGINLRIVDAGNDGDGDIQAFSGTWNTVLADAFTFGDTTTFELTINGYGASFSYDLTVGGTTVAGLTAFQSAGDGVVDDFSTIGFVSSSVASGASAEVDNVSVSVVPEPGSLALLGLGSLLIARRRRNA